MNTMHKPGFLAFRRRAVRICAIAAAAVAVGSVTAVPLEEEAVPGVGALAASYPSAVMVSFNWAFVSEALGH